ncbi:MAG: DOMON-like domain-containing protein [Gammaproteobacteria bacterium]|nr:DOMON-like domain-containing protein [Gammaproteobacteria bacterium]
MGFVCDSLVPHPARMPPPVRAFAAAASWAAGRPLALCFRLEAPLESLALPAGGGGRADRLWEHTCFEAFLAPATGTRYRELNFSPSGEWAAYAFARYRERDASLAEVDVVPLLTVARTEGRLDLTAVLPLDRLAVLAGSRALRVALSAVVEEAGGRLSYWALRHPAGSPDFHHPDAFALAVELGGLERPDPREG